MVEMLIGLVLASAVSGVVPLVNAELLVVGAAAALPMLGIPLVAAATAAGQMAAKTALFVIARWAPSRLPARARKALAGSRDALARRGGAAGSLVLASAATGLPPFYGVSLAAGALGMRLRSFVLAGTVGRFGRFAVLAWLGQAVGG